MLERLSIALEMARALAQVGVAEMARDGAGFSPLSLFLPETQLVSTERSRAFFSSFKDNSVTFFSDKLAVCHCFVGVGGALLVIGPYRTSELKRAEARGCLRLCGADSGLLAEYLAYHRALALKDTGLIRVIARTLLTGVYGDEQEVTEHAFDMLRDEFHGPDDPQCGAPLPAAHAIERTHGMESYYMEQIKLGRFETALSACDAIRERSRPHGAGVDYVSMIEGFAILRTLTRLAVRDSGVPASAVNALTERYKRMAHGARDDEELRPIAVQFISESCALVRQYRKAPYNRQIRQALDIIHRRAGEPLTVAEIAEEVGISANWLTTKFREATGKTPVAYLTAHRLESAAHLLAYTEMDIQSVSASVGVMDSNYFAKLFRKAYGVTPSDYRSNPGLLYAAEPARD